MQETGTPGRPEQERGYLPVPAEQEREELPGLADLQVRGRPVKIWAIGAGAVVLAISAAFGGLNKAEAENPPLAAGTAVNAGQFEVTVQRVVTVTDLKPLFTPEPGGALIAVVTKLKVTDDTGATPPSDLIRLIGVPGLEDDARPVGTATLDDNTQSPVLTPDAAEDVAYVFKLPKLSELPTEAKVTVQGYEHYDESLLDHHEKWLPADIVAEGTIKVTDKTKPSKS